MDEVRVTEGKGPGGPGAVWAAGPREQRPGRGRAEWGSGAPWSFPSVSGAGRPPWRSCSQCTPSAMCSSTAPTRSAASNWTTGSWQVGARGRLLFLYPSWLTQPQPLLCPLVQLCPACPSSTLDVPSLPLVPLLCTAAPGRAHALGLSLQGFWHSGCS